MAIHDAREARRVAQQGLGRPIISVEMADHRIVAVGNSVRWGKWKTFFDFLSDYIRQILGEPWGNAELAKPLAERHPILRWYDSLCRLQRSSISELGKVSTVDMNGAAAAWFGLAYSLYLLAHNAQLQAKLIARLKHIDQFRGAYYETLVAGWFALAGFELELEDESDGSGQHCEFTATSKKTGKQYSVEAKSREAGKDHLDVGNQLAKALRKTAAHDRIVMIDINVPHDPARTLIEWGDAIRRSIRGREEKLTIGGRPAPAAYVVVTNHPYSYDLEATSTGLAVLGEGFKIADFGSLVPFPNLIAAFKAKQKHSDVGRLIEAVGHFTIPSTFDGEVPEIAFGKASREWIVGKRYDLSAYGHGFSVLVSAAVSEERQCATLMFQSDSGTFVIQAPLSDADMTAYRQHRETYFGVKQNVRGSLRTPLELMEWLYDGLKSAPREQHLESLKNAPDFSELTKLTTEELVLQRCARMAAAVPFQSAAEAPLTRT